MMHHSITDLVMPHIDDVAALICRSTIQWSRWRTAVNMTRSAAATSRLVTPSPFASGDTSARHARLRTITWAGVGRCRTPASSTRCATTTATLAAAGSGGRGRAGCHRCTEKKANRSLAIINLRLHVHPRGRPKVTPDLSGACSSRRARLSRCRASATIAVGGRLPLDAPGREGGLLRSAPSWAKPGEILAAERGLAAGTLPPPLELSPPSCPPLPRRPHRAGIVV